MPRRKREEGGEPVIVDGQVVGFQLPLPDPTKETNLAHAKRRKNHKRPAEPHAPKADS